MLFRERLESVSNAVFDERPVARRRIALLLYALVTPPFVATIVLVPRPGTDPFWPAVLVLVLCAIGALIILPRRPLTAAGWILPSAIVPIVSCGVGFHTCGISGAAFLAVTAAPIGWSAALFEGPVVVAAWLTSILTCVTVVWQDAGPALAAVNGTLVLIIHGLVAWVVYGKSTMHREALRELQASQAMFSTAFENSPDAIYVSDVDTGHFLQVNAGFERLTGYTRTDAIGKSSNDLNLWEAYADRSRFFDEMRTSGRVRGFTARFRGADGRLFWGESFADPVTVQGRRCVLTTTHDLSERLKAEAELRAERDFAHVVMDTMAEGLVVTGADGRVEYVNRACAVMIGRRQEDVPGHPPEDFASPGVRERVIQGTKERLAGRTSQYEVRLARPDGSEVDVLVTAAPRVRAGVVDGSVAVMTDLTEHKAHEASRLQLEREVQRAQKHASLGTLASGIAHHLNNLLTVVHGSLEMAMLDSAVPPTMADHLSQAADAIVRAASLGRMMLAYTGQRVQNTRRLNLAAAVDRLIPLLRSAIPPRIQLVVDVPRSLPVVAVDIGSLEQVLTNLVLNAWDALGDRNGTIAIEAVVTSFEQAGASRTEFPTHRDRRAVCLAINDTGVGMSRETLALAFDPFYSTKMVGRGLGLPVSLGIVRAAGGTIMIESALGQGTTARVLLPVSESLPESDS